MPHLIVGENMKIILYIPLLFTFAVNCLQADWKNDPDAYFGKSVDYEIGGAKEVRGEMKGPEK